VSEGPVASSVEIAHDWIGAAVGAADSEEYRMLLVEDDPGDALLVRELLIDTGLRHRLRWAQTLADAVVQLRREVPDCVVMDLHLPDASGIAAVQELQQACPPTGVIVLTGLSESRTAIAAVLGGAQDYLVKDQVDADQLGRAIRYAVHRKRAELATVELAENRLRAEENARLERGLLPQPLLASDAVRVTSRYLPSRDQAQLGGDFLDVVQTEPDIVHAIIGDVSGHGPDEAALGVSLRISWRALVLAGHTGIDALDHLERILVAERTDTEVFTTCSTLTIDLARRSARVLLAGHHEPLLLNGGVTLVRAAYGTALGISPGRRRWTPTTIELPERGALVLYTDGLIEGHAGPAKSDQDSTDRLGVEGLLKLISAAPPGEPGALLDHLVSTAQALDGGRHEDDLAILHLAWGGGLAPQQEPGATAG
jgi:serine phosphatase RsbU (regulator of sigma subunit)